MNISINTNKNPIAVSSNVSQNKNQFSLTPLEIVLNRLFAVLLFLSIYLFFLTNFLTPIIIIYIVFAIFLWFSKKYHLFINILFFIIALGIYFINPPWDQLGLGLFRYLKEFRFNGFDFLNFGSLHFIAPLIFVSFSVKNILSNISAYFKTSTVARNVFLFLYLLFW